MAGPKYANDLVMDAALDYVAGATVLRVCSVLGATPTHAQAVTATLASVTIDGSDFTKANGDTNGRKTTIGAQNAVSVSATGSAENVVLTSTGDTTVRYMTSCTTQSLTSGNTVNVPAWDIEIADPTP